MRDGYVDHEYVASETASARHQDRSQLQGQSLAFVVVATASWATERAHG